MTDFRKTTLADMFRSALANRAELRVNYGTATHRLANGDVLYCCLDNVAGRSITRRHIRKTFRLLTKGEEFSKQISRDTAVALLAAE